MILHTYKFSNFKNYTQTTTIIAEWMLFYIERINFNIFPFPVA